MAQCIVIGPVCVCVCGGRAGGVRTLLQPARAQCLRLSERFFHSPQIMIVPKDLKLKSNTGLLGLGLGLEAKFSGLGLGFEAFGLGLVFLALALLKAKVKVTNILPNTVYLGIITLTVHWYTSIIGTTIVRRQVLFGTTR